MKYYISLALVCMLVICFVSCDKQFHRNDAFKKWIQSNGKVKVLSTISMIDALVKDIGQDHVDSLTLIRGELDPHSYQLVKGDDEKLTFADIIFYNGLELEHGPSLHSHLNANPKAVGLGDQIKKENPALIIYVKGQKDPHIWMDISLWTETIPFIVKALSQKDPAHAQEYQDNGALLTKKLLESHHAIRSYMQEIPENRRYLVTSHDAFNYFTRAYLSEDSELATGEWIKRFAAPEGLAPESQLSVTDIQDIINHMKLHRIELLFPESNVSQDSIRKILQAGRANGLKLQIACCPLYGDAMGAPGSEGDTYVKMIEYDAKTIGRYMKSDKDISQSPN